LALPLCICSTKASSGQEPPKPATIRVKTGDAQVVAEPGAAVAVDARTTRREFRVVDIRPPDIGIWFDPTATDSLVIADIATTGPVAALGFQEGDRILEVNRVKVNRETDFIKLLFATKARDGRVEVLIVRKNKEMVIPVEPALLEEHYVVVRHDPLEQLGFVVDDRYDDRVVVWKVLPRSPAFYAGLRPGDVITRFGDQRVVQRKAFTGLVEKVEPGVLTVEVDRAKRTRPIRIDVPREWNVGYRGDAKVETDVPRRDAPPPPPREPRDR
jgi:S1-C subfamily serine protease